MKKRILSIILSIVMLVSLLPTTAFAAGTDTGKAIQLVDSGTAANIGGGQADSIYFGTYKQSSDRNSGYNVDPIKWRVLSNADGKLFLLSNQNLDVFKYHKEKESVTWETSTMRSWLNGYVASSNTGGDSGVDYTNDNFLDTAFSAKEQAAIADTKVVNDDNGSVDGGNDTTDKVFLLSIAEAKNTSYFADDNSRIATDTAYVAGGGEIGGSMNSVGRDDYWWLRSPGEYDYCAAYVEFLGSVHSNGPPVNYANCAVRPAFNLNLESVLFTSAADNSGHISRFGTALPDYSGSEWKLTLKDGNDFSTDAAINATKTYAGGKLEITHKALSSFVNAAYTDVTAMLQDAEGKILYYGSIDTNVTATKTILTIPTDIAVGDYVLSVYAEDWNGAYATDYATSIPFTTTISIRHIHPVCGATCTHDTDATTEGVQAAHTAVAWEPITSASELAAMVNGKSYYLGEDITVSSSISISGTVNLCLNGHTISAAGGYFDVAGTGTLNLCSCKENGIIKRTTTTNALISADNGAAANLYNVTLDGGAVWSGTEDAVLGRGTTNSGITSSAPLIYAGGQRTVGGHITLNSGVILQNNECSDAGDGGAITLGEDGTLVINGATICNNAKTSDNAGAIKAYAGAQITMNSGEIYGNEAYKHGGAVQIFGGESTDEEVVVFTMNGGTIRNNKANGVGGGIAVSDYSQFIMNGGTIKDNATTDYSKRGGGVGFGDRNTAMSISGNAVISGNVAGINPNNLYIGNNDCNKLSVETMGSNANVGVTMSSPGVFSSGGASYAAQFNSDNAAYKVATDGSNLKLVALHTHNYTYSATGNIITESCTCGHSKTATLEIDTSVSTVYNGSAIKALKVSYSDGWVGDLNAEISYTNNTNVGTASGSVTIDGATATKSFTITKKTAEAPATPTAQNSITYGAKLSEVGLTAGWAWTDGNVIPTVNNSGYTAYYTPADVTNLDWTAVDGWNASAGRVERTVAVTVNKSAPTYTEPTAITATYGDTLADVELPAGWTWKDTGTTSVGNAGTRTFKALYNPDSNNYITAEADIMLEVTKAAPEVAAPTAKTGLEYSGSAMELINDGTVNGGEIRYKLGELGIYGTAIPFATNAGTYTVYWKVVGDSNHKDTAEQSITVTVADTTDPTGEIHIKDNSWKKFLNWISFGLFCKENVDVIVTADGTGSAVDKVEYLFSATALNEENLPADGWKTAEGNNGTYTFAITAQNKGAVYVKITDAYGNVAVINSDGIVVYTDSSVTMDTVYFTYQSNEDVVIDLELNGNTVENVLFNGHEIAGHWSVDGNKLTLNADYLGRLVVLDNGGSYPVTVYFNPLGVETDKVELKDEFSLVIQKANGSVTNISDISKTYDSSPVSEPTFDKLGDGAATIEYKVKGADDSTYTTTAPKNTGDYVVRVTVAEGTNYKEAYGTAEFEIEKADAEIDDNPAAINGLIYNGNPQALVSAGSTDDGVIKYSLDGVVYSTNIPEVTNAGTYSVYVRIVGDENHNNSDLVPVEVKIDKATVTEPAIANKPYTGSAQTADIVDTDLYTVEQNNGGTAQGNYDVVLKLKDAGNYKWATTDDEEVTVQFVISAAENSWMTEPSISGWTYGEAAKDPTGEAKYGTVKVTYTGKANDGSDYNGETAPTKAGNYTAIFTVAGTEDYSGLSESVDFTIAKATYDMSSAEWDYTDAFKYDGKEHKVEVVGLPEGVTIGGYNGNTATVVGEYTAKVTLTYDTNNYNAPSVADLNWKVENNWTPTEYAVNGSGWMNYDFVITANNGYKVSLTNTADGGWEDTLTCSAETDNGSVTFYLKNESDGTISLAKTVTYKLDKTAPTGKVEFVDRTGWQEFVNTITFGLFYKDEVTVKITAADDLSGVAKVEYYASDDALTLDEVKAITDWTAYSDSFGVTFEDAKKFVYYVRITDNAGNVTYISTDGAEYDITAPVIIGVENGKTYYTTQKVTVSDKNLDTVTLNGNAVTGTVTLDGDKDVTYTIVATDKAGNSTTVSVTMKPIRELAKATENLGPANVTSDDAPALRELIAKLNELLADEDVSNDGERETLEQHKSIAESLLRTIDDTKAELARIDEELNKHNGDTVNSDDAAALEQLAKDIQELLDGDNLTDAERTALTENAGKVADMQKTVADTAAENKRISDAVDGYDLATVTSDDKADLEQLLADIEKQLESTHLTEEEISELNGDKKAVEDLLIKIKGTDELIEKLTQDVNVYSDETVKSTDKDAIEQIIEDIDALLETENLTEDEKKALEDAKDKAEGLLETIDDADKATETENTEKVKDVTAENVTPEDKTDLEKAKDDLEKALEDYGDNYTDDEKKAIEDEIKHIDDALEVIGNVEAVEEVISKLPAVDTVKPDDEESIKAITDAQTAYNALSDYEKSLVDEAAKANLDKLAAALVAYDIVEGDGSSWTEDSGHNITFVVNGLLDKFVGIKVDGKDVDKANYEVKAGSTIITLKASYLDTLTVGEHTITVVYTDGGTDGTFNVHAKANSPATGDNSHLMLWIVLLLISGGALVTLTVVDRKRRMASKR